MVPRWAHMVPRWATCLAANLTAGKQVVVFGTILHMVHNGAGAFSHWIPAYLESLEMF